MNARYLPSLSFVVMMTIGALGVFVVGFAYGYEAEPAGPPPPDRSRLEHAGPVADLPPLPGAMIEAHLAFLKTALKVTDAQISAWNAIADVLREQAKRRDADMMARRKARQDAAQPPDLLEMLQDRQRMDVIESDDLSKLLIALRPFYVMLNAEQKETAGHLFPQGHSGPGKGRPPGPREDGPGCQPFFRYEVR
jgi:hypothetical protein